MQRTGRNVVGAVGLVALVASAAGAQAGTGRKATPAATRAGTANAAQAVALREEDAYFHRRLMDLRAQYLEGATWANLGDRCNPGALRIFANDTSVAQRDAKQALSRRIEQTIVGRGAGNPVDTPEGRKLLRVIVGWEAGIDRPHWDSDEVAPRQAISAGLTGQYPDPNGPGCLTAIEQDTVTFVVPGFTDMTFPNAPDVRVKAYFGPRAVNHARDEFASRHGNTPGAELSYNFVSPFVMWRDWAVVVVTRPLEERGVVVGRRNNGGAVYLMRKVGDEWRLLSIMRTWGS